LLLIHGGGTWAYTWHANIRELAKHFTVYALDMPGFGLTTSQKKFSPTEDYFADFIKAFLDALELKNIDVAGSSWGGGWALRFAEEYPAYVRKIVIIGSTGLFYHKLKRPTFLWNLINIPGIGRLLSRYFMWPSILMSQYKSLIAHPGKASKEIGHELAIGFRHTDNRRVLYEYGYRNMWRKTDNALETIERPVLIIWGDKDPMLPVSDANKLQKRLPYARLEILPDTGHLPQEESSEAVNRLIVSFLKR
jgi:pimeloyl-ACP methyl ester carboxylesterase